MALTINEALAWVNVLSNTKYPTLQSLSDGVGYIHAFDAMEVLTRPHPRLLLSKVKFNCSNQALCEYNMRLVDNFSQAYPSLKESVDVSQLAQGHIPSHHQFISRLFMTFHNVVTDATALRRYHAAARRAAAIVRQHTFASRHLGAAAPRIAVPSHLIPPPTSEIARTRFLADISAAASVPDDVSRSVSAALAPSHAHVPQSPLPAAHTASPLPPRSSGGGPPAVPPTHSAAAAASLRAGTISPRALSLAARAAAPHHDPSAPLSASPHASPSYASPLVVSGTATVPPPADGTAVDDDDDDGDAHPATAVRGDGPSAAPRIDPCALTYVGESPRGSRSRPSSPRERLERILLAQLQLDLRAAARARDEMDVNSASVDGDLGIAPARPTRSPRRPAAPADGPLPPAYGPGPSPLPVLSAATRPPGPAGGGAGSPHRGASAHPAAHGAGLDDGGPQWRPAVPPLPSGSPHRAGAHRGGGPYPYRDIDDDNDVDGAPPGSAHPTYVQLRSPQGGDVRRGGDWGGMPGGWPGTQGGPRRDAYHADARHRDVYDDDDDDDDPHLHRGGGGQYGTSDTQYGGPSRARRGSGPRWPNGGGGWDHAYPPTNPQPRSHSAGHSPPQSARRRHDGGDAASASAYGYGRPRRSYSVERSPRGDGPWARGSGPADAPRRAHSSEWPERRSPRPPPGGAYPPHPGPTRYPPGRDAYGDVDDDHDDEYADVPPSHVPPGHGSPHATRAPYASSGAYGPPHSRASPYQSPSGVYGGAPVSSRDAWDTRNTHGPSRSAGRTGDARRAYHDSDDDHRGRAPFDAYDARPASPYREDRAHSPYHATGGPHPDHPNPSLSDSRHRGTHRDHFDGAAARDTAARAPRETLPSERAVPDGMGPGGRGGSPRPGARGVVGVPVPPLDISGGGLFGASGAGSDLHRERSPLRHGGPGGGGGGEWHGVPHGPVVVGGQSLRDQQRAHAVHTARLAAYRGAVYDDDIDGAGPSTPGRRGERSASAALAQPTPARSLLAMTDGVRLHVHSGDDDDYDEDDDDARGVGASRRGGPRSRMAAAVVRVAAAAVKAVGASEGYEVVHHHGNGHGAPSARARRAARRGGDDLDGGSGSLSPSLSPSSLAAHNSSLNAKGSSGRRAADAQRGGGQGLDLDDDGTSASAASRAEVGRRRRRARGGMGDMSHASDVDVFDGDIVDDPGDDDDDDDEDEDRHDADVRGAQGESGARHAPARGAGARGPGGKGTLSSSIPPATAAAAAAALGWLAAVSGDRAAAVAAARSGKPDALRYADALPAADAASVAATATTAHADVLAAASCVAEAEAETLAAAAAAARARVEALRRELIAVTAIAGAVGHAAATAAQWEFEVLNVGGEPVVSAMRTAHSPSRSLRGSALADAVCEVMFAKEACMDGDA